MFNRENMKKIVLVLVIVMVAGLSIGSAIVVATGGLVRNGSAAQRKIDEEKIIPLQGITNLRIESVSTRLNFIPTDGTELRVRLYGEVNSSRADYYPELDTTVSSSSASVRLKWPAGGVVGFLMTDLKMDVYMPSSYSANLEIGTSSARVEIGRQALETLKINSVSGDIKLSDIHAKTLTVETSSGNAKLNNINCKDLGYKSVSGDLTAEQVNADKATFDTSSGNYILRTMQSTTTSFRSVSGDLTATGFEAASTTLRASSGKLSVDGNAGDVTFDTVSGSVTLKYTEFARAVNGTTSSGNVRVELPKVTEFGLEFNTSSGKLNNDFAMSYSNLSKNSIVGATANGQNLIKVRTVSGDVTVIGR